MKSPVQSVRLVLCLAATCVALSSSARAENNAGPTTGPATEHPFAVDRWTAKEQKIVDALNRPLKEPLSFVDTDLKTLIDTLADAHDILILPDIRSLEDAQINLSEERLSIDLADVTLRSALNIILPQFELAYVIEDEAMHILWDQDAGSRKRTVVYDLGPLLALGYDLETVANVVLSNTWRSEWHPDDPDKVVEAVPGGLVVTQDQRTHDDIEAILSRLLTLGRRNDERGSVRGQDESAPAKRRPRRSRNRPLPGSRKLHAETSSTVIYELTPLVEKGIDPQRLADVIQAHVEAGSLGASRPVLSIFDRTVSPLEQFERYLCGENDPAKFIRQRGFSMEVLPTTARFADESPRRLRVDDGLIEAIGSALVVHQPQRVHDDIKRFLERLNAAGRELRQEAKEDESEPGS